MKKTLYLGITTLKGEIADVVDSEATVVRSLPILLHSEAAINPPEGTMPPELRNPYLTALAAASANPGTPVHVDFSGARGDDGQEMPDDYDDFLVALSFDIPGEGN